MHTHIITNATIILLHLHTYNIIVITVAFCSNLVMISFPLMMIVHAYCHYVD